jgi:hypothetical protein
MSERFAVWSVPPVDRPAHLALSFTLDGLLLCLDRKRASSAPTGSCRQDLVQSVWGQVTKTVTRSTWIFQVHG